MDDDSERRFGGGLFYYDEIEPEVHDSAARLAHLKAAAAGTSETHARHRPRTQSLPLVRRLLEDVLLLDTNRVNAASVAKHLGRYALAVERANNPSCSRDKGHSQSVKFA